MKIRSLSLFAFFVVCLLLSCFSNSSKNSSTTDAAKIKDSLQMDSLNLEVKKAEEELKAFLKDN